MEDILIGTPVYEIKGKSKKLHIKDDAKFLSMLSATDNLGNPEAGANDVYLKLKAYGRKSFSSAAAEISKNELDSIINWAILKTISGFDASKGASLLTYFHQKILGELTDYRQKRESVMKKVHMALNSEESEYAAEFDENGSSISLDKVTNETPESELIEEEVYYRKLQAFRMAFSGIPKFSQYILLRTSGDESIASIAREENLSLAELSKIRNYALSLILKRVLRSNHLTEDEKEEVKQEHGIESDKVA